MIYKSRRTCSRPLSMRVTVDLAVTRCANSLLGRAGQIHSRNYSIHKNGLLIYSMHDKLRANTDENVVKQIVISFC